MKLCIQVEFDDNAKPEEVDIALRKVATFAGNSVYNEGVLQIDEERDLPDYAAYIKAASIFRPE